MRWASQDSKTGYGGAMRMILLLLHREGLWDFGQMIIAIECGKSFRKGNINILYRNEEEGEEACLTKLLCIPASHTPTTTLNSL